MKQSMYAIKWYSTEGQDDSDYDVFCKVFNTRELAHKWLLFIMSMSIASMEIEYLLWQQSWKWR